MKPNTASAPARQKTVLASINEALHAMMEADERVIVLGEDILDPYGGAFKVTKGLSTRFPSRVLTTPISESAIVGMANGMAMRGLRPVAELMFGDFVALAADQLINHAAKFSWMYNDAVDVPMVVRTPVGGRRGYGPTHSQSLEKHFIGVPGLTVLAPHILGDPGRLLHQATLECDSPVLFIESKLCYGKPLMAGIEGMTAKTYSDEDCIFPTVRLSHNQVEMPDAMLFCYGAMVPHCVQAVARLRQDEELFVDLVILSQLSPVPEGHLQWVLAEACPAVMVYAEEGSPTGGWTAEMLARVEEQRSGQSALKHTRIGSRPTPLASSRELEQITLPQTDDIVEAVLNCF
jgi:pyruvate/2-oxoglutarate/acetoin dehydrogenase E1 component